MQPSIDPLWQGLHACKMCGAALRNGERVRGQYWNPEVPLDAYEAVNLLEALKMIPSTGDWHGQLRFRCQAVLDKYGNEYTVPNQTVEQMSESKALDARRLQEVAHAAVSWTYMPPERHTEALLKIRRLIKESQGWFTGHDEQLEREALQEDTTNKELRALATEFGQHRIDSNLDWFEDWAARLYALLESANLSGPQESGA